MRRRPDARAEYTAYFALIFVIALPFALLQWGYRVVRPNPRRANFGILRRAHEQASMVTPMIFATR